MAINTQLRIEGCTFGVLRCQYSFSRSINAKGMPTTGIQGGELQVELESTEDTMLLDLFFTREPRLISGSLEVWNEAEQAPIRTIEWAEAYIYAVGEGMQSYSSLPMSLTICITPLRLDINRTIRIDRRWPKTYGFRWEEYVPEEVAAANPTSEEEKEPEITKLCFKDADGNEIKNQIPSSQIITLYAETKNIPEGDIFTFVLEQEGAKKPIEVQAEVGKSGVVIKNFTFYDYNIDLKIE